MTREGTGTALRPWRWGCSASIALLLVTAVLWLLAHRMRPLGDPEWTMADLPEAPADDVNGWALTQTRVRLRELPSELQDLVRDEQGDVGQVRDRVGQHADDIEEELGHDAELRLSVAARPRFVDGCRPTAEVACNLLPVLDLWRQRALAVMVGAHRGRWDEAAREAEVMWSQGADFASTCRTIVSCVAAPNLLAVTLRAIEVMAYDAEGVDPELIERLIERIEATDLARPSMQHGLIGEYITMRDALASGEGATMVFDVAHTERMLREDLVAAHDYAATPPGPRPALRMRTEEPFWWAYNPGGKILVDQVMALDYARHVDHHRDALRRVVEARTRTLSMLRQRARVESERSEGPLSEARRVGVAR